MNLEEIIAIIEDRKLLVAVSLITALFFMTALPVHSLNQAPDERKVAVIVLDGADYKVIDRMTENGELPNIQKLEENGVSTSFGSPEAFSPQSWTKMGTGMSTQNISVERSWTYTDDGGNQKRLESGAVKHRRFWSYLNEEGIETGVYQWLPSWPVEPVKGFMVSGMLTANLDQMTYPEDVGVPDESLESSIVGFNTFETIDKITDRYYGMETLFYGIHISDRVQHGFWKYMEDDQPENQEYRELIYRSYREADELVGRLRPEYTVILVSDHGFTRPWTDTYQADLNGLLDQVGLTEYEVGSSNMAREERFGARSVIAHKSAENDVLNNTHYRVEFEHLDKSKAPESVISELQMIMYPDGDRFLRNISYAEGRFNAVMFLDPEFRGQEYLEERHMRMSYARGKLSVLQRNITLNYRGDSYTTKIGPMHTGGHPPGTSGVFYMAGEGVKQQGRAEVDITTEDLTPVILYLKGVSIPEEMDGKVPRELFNRKYLSVNPPEREDKEVLKQEFDVEVDRNTSQDSRISGRLEELGYLR